jgi:putative ABC transport system permease protein
MLSRALWRGMLAMRWRILAAGLILGSALAMFAGIYSAIDSLFAFRDRLYSDLQAADLEVRFIPDDVINLPDLSRAPGVAAMEHRLMLPGHVDLKSGSKLYATLIALDLDQPVDLNRLKILEGLPLDPKKPDEIVIERNLAKYHGYHVGDRLRLVVGRDHYDLTVRGIALSPEFLIDSANPNFFLPSKGSMGVIFAPLRLIEARLGYKLVDSLVFRLAPGQNAEQAGTAIARLASKKITVEETLPRHRQFGHLYLELDLNAFKVFVPAIVIIFVATAIIIIVFLLYQWLRDQRRQIGVFMALGYGTRQLFGAYVLPVGAIAAIAIVSGLLLSFVMLYGFGYGYAEALGLPRPQLTLLPRYVVLGSLGVLLVLALSSAYPLAGILRLSPQDAVRGERRVTDGRVGRFGTWLTSLFSNSTASRYALRNLARARGTTLLTVFAVALALGAPLSYFISLTSFESAVVKSFANDRWDLAVDFIAPVWRDELGPLERSPGVSSVDFYLRGPIRIVRGEREEPSFMLGITAGSPSRTPRILEGRGLVASDTDAILLERKTAASLGYHIGDEVIIDVRDVRSRARLVGIFSGALPGESYAPLATAQRWLDMDGQGNGAFLRTGANFPRADALYSLDRVGRVTEKSILVGEFVAHLKEIAAIIYLAFAFSLAVALLFVFSTTSFSVLKREPEYATLRTLGFSDAIVVKIVLIEIIVIGIAGLLLALPAGIAISIFLNKVLSQAWFTIDTVVTMQDALIVLIPALFLFPLTGWPPIRSIRAAGLVQQIRRRAVE